MMIDKSTKNNLIQFGSDRNAFAVTDANRLRQSECALPALSSLSDSEIGLMEIRLFTKTPAVAAHFRNLWMASVMISSPESMLTSV